METGQDTLNPASLPREKTSRGRLRLGNCPGDSQCRVPILTEATCSQQRSGPAPGVGTQQSSPHPRPQIPTLVEAEVGTQLKISPPQPE